jgi:hypothetical protein
MPLAKRNGKTAANETFACDAMVSLGQFSAAFNDDLERDTHLLG